MSKYTELKEEVEKRGDELSPLFPARWVELSGRFTLDELEVIVDAIKLNYKTWQ